MLHKNKVRSIAVGFRGLVLFALLAVTCLAAPALAEGNGPVVSVERLHGLGVGINLVFPEDVEPNLSIFLNGKMMDCELVAPNQLYCVGNLRPNETVTLSVYGETGITTSFSIATTGPDLNKEPEPVIDPCIIAATFNQQGGFKLASPSPSLIEIYLLSWSNNCDL